MELYYLTYLLCLYIDPNPKLTSSVPTHKELVDRFSTLINADTARSHLKPLLNKLMADDTIAPTLSGLDLEARKTLSSLLTNYQQLLIQAASSNLTSNVLNKSTNLLGSFLTHLPVEFALQQFLSLTIYLKQDPTRDLDTINLLGLLESGLTSLKKNLISLRKTEEMQSVNHLSLKVSFDLCQLSLQQVQLQHKQQHGVADVATEAAVSTTAQEQAFQPINSPWRLLKNQQAEAGQTNSLAASAEQAAVAPSPESTTELSDVPRNAAQEQTPELTPQAILESINNLVEVKSNLVTKELTEKYKETKGAGPYLEEAIDLISSYRMNNHAIMLPLYLVANRAPAKKVSATEDEGEVAFISGGKIARRIKHDKPQTETSVVICASSSKNQVGCAVLTEGKFVADKSFVITGKPGLVLTEYLYSWLEHKRENLLGKSKATGRVYDLPAAEIDAFEVPVPSLEIQEKIAKAVRATQRKRAQLKSQQQGLKSVLDEAFKKIYSGIKSS